MGWERRLRVAKRKFDKKMSNLSKNEAKRLETVKKLALKLMHEHNLTDYNFKFGYGWRYRGMCTAKSIIIQYKFALYGDIDEVKNTILHEIAHAIVGLEKGHREEWQQKAKELGVVWTRKYRK